MRAFLAFSALTIIEEGLINYPVTRPRGNTPVPTPRNPRGRGRPPSIDSEQLLSVAREVFLERGIRATTLEVAVRAGVSEGALFHRFKNKEGLFRAAMELPAEQVPELLLEAVQRLHDLE